jgi:hypothetical protein
MLNSIRTSDIESILSKSEFNIQTIFDKVTIVSCKLPNGFVIVESSGCVDKENYNAKLGQSECMNKIRNKLWELEGYRLQCKLKEKEKDDNSKTKY